MSPVHRIRPAHPVRPIRPTHPARPMRPIHPTHPTHPDCRLKAAMNPWTAARETTRMRTRLRRMTGSSTTSPMTPL
ncbi:MAG: hypothetical protein LBT52_00460 [Clostridiales Family XIII bacterium]|nr:hypothetical protein [Clostridiales Family XIII bacterium]